ncbi:hypothetical protein C8J57DRAFT_1217158 [Mycena rebaudengoi]|nr:hypothetical protein C8J57DRAFT_1217158 [Mycena rebaudengoi]
MNPEHAQYINSYSASEEERIVEDSDVGYQMDLVEATVDSSMNDSASEDDNHGRQIYLAIPKWVKLQKKIPEVHSTECTVPSTRNVRHVVFDGVQVPSKEEIRNRPNKQIGRDTSAPTAPDSRPAPLDQKNATEYMPAIQPVDARQYNCHEMRSTLSAAKLTHLSKQGFPLPVRFPKNPYRVIQERWDVNLNYKLQLM